MSDGPSALDLATLGIAVVGAALGMLSFAWQVATWRMSGPRVRVKTTHAYLPYPGVGLLHGIGIEAQNSGREAVEVRGWGLRLPDGRTAVVPAPRPGNPPTPYTLAGGHSAQWFTLLVDMAPEQANIPLSGFVNLGNGTTVVGNALTISPESYRAAADEGAPGIARQQGHVMTKA